MGARGMHGRAWVWAYWGGEKFHGGRLIDAIDKWDSRVVAERVSGRDHGASSK